MSVLTNMKRRYALKSEDDNSVRRFFDGLVRRAGGTDGL